MRKICIQPQSCYKTTPHEMLTTSKSDTSWKSKFRCCIFIGADSLLNSILSSHLLFCPCRVRTGARYLTLFATRLKIYPTFNPFQLSVAFYIETSHLLCSAKQMNGFYIEHNTRLKWVYQKKMTERGSCIIHTKVDIWPGKWSTSL